MTATQIRDATPLAAASAELLAADAAVAKVEREVAPVLDRCAAWHEQLNDATGTRGSGSLAARRAASEIVRLSAQVTAARRKVEVAQRKRDAARETVESEQRAIADLERRIAGQQQREARQAAVIEATERQLAEKRVALDVERRELRRLRDELATLKDDHVHEPP